MNYFCEFLVVIAAGLVVSCIEGYWARKKEAKNRPIKLRKNCIEKIQHCINELDFNERCMGGPTCPFKTQALERLLDSEEITLLNQDLTNSLKQFINKAGIARGHHMEIASGRVRHESKLLKHSLHERREELMSHPDI